MLRSTAVKATGSGLLRGPACSACRRSISLTSTARATASHSSKFGLTTRRPLAIVDRLSSGRRYYAAATDAGVVSLARLSPLF